MSPRMAALALLGMIASAPAGHARITQVRIDHVETFADGAAFGATGAYQRIIGVAKGELDPADPRNAGIADIARAPRNAAGKVEYETDLFILRPTDPSKGNHHLLFDILNRGNKLAVRALNELSPPDDSNDPMTSAQAGDGFLFRRGYTVAWAGWDPDAPTRNHGMTIRIPALPDIAQEMRDEFVSGTRAPALTQFHLSYTAVDTKQPTATLTVRQREQELAGCRAARAVALRRSANRGPAARGHQAGTRRAV